MAIPVAHTRKRGNPNWGCPILPAPVLPTKFELQVKHLHLTAEMFTRSRDLRAWCEQNRNQLYVPEWLLEEWGITVDPTFSAPSRDHPTLKFQILASPSQN